MKDAGLMTIGGTKVLRNADLLPLEDAQLKRAYPTIFQKKAIEGVSDNYGHVRTIDIINAMRDSGYELVEVRQSMRRDENRIPFTKHMVKLAPRDGKKLARVGDVVPQIVMLNSHDRSSGFHLHIGMFRLVCSNGLIVADSKLVEPIRVRHTTSMVEDIVKKSAILVKGADGVYKLREEMLGVKMTQKQAMEFATAACEFRPPRRAGVIDAPTLLTAKRAEDDVLNLWAVFNRVQENLVMGGTASVTSEGRNIRTKGIGRIERDVQVNSKLWELAMATLDGSVKPRKVKAKITAEELGI